MTKKRDYKREYANYQGTPEQKKRRAARGRSRYKMMKAGKVRIGDGKDVDHLDHNTSNMSSSNLRVQPKGINRSFTRTSTGAVKK